jgi:predicted GNAT family acetyltransferase
VSEAVTDNAAERRFELDLAGRTAFIDYRRAGSTLYLNHAEVPPELRGHGAGARLVKATLELVRERGERVVPVCPFVQAFMHRHPEYAGLRAT